MKAENDFTTSAEEKDDERGWWIGPLIIVLMVGVIGFFMHDSLMQESKIWVQLTLKADCNYIVPEGFEIISDGKLYVVRHKTKYGWEYLSGEQSDIREYGINISKPTYLFSECKAKAYLKKYIKQHAIEDLSNFKTISKQDDVIHYKYVFYNGKMVMYHGKQVISY